MQLKFLTQSLWYYRKSHLGVLAGTALGATVLLGALFAGDSVSGALKRLASLRVGQAEYLLVAGDRFVREDLASDLASGLGVPAAPALMLRGSASRSDRGAIDEGASSPSERQLVRRRFPRGFLQPAPAVPNRREPLLRR